MSFPHIKHMIQIIKKKKFQNSEQDGVGVLLKA
jgi:hypothetical protein